MLALVISLMFVLPQPGLSESYLKAYEAHIADPRSEQKLVALVSILYELDQTSRAVTLLEQFLKTSPNSSQAKLFLALGYTRSEKYEQGRTLAAQAASELPRDYHAQHVLALSLAGLNRFDEAELRFKRALEIKPDFADAYFQLGMLYARKPDTLQQAKSSFQKAYEAGFRTAEVSRNLASVSLKLGDVNGAIEHLNASLALDPNYADAHFLLADAMRKAGSPEKAAESMQKFQALNATALEQREKETKSHSLYQEGVSSLAKDDLARAYNAFKTAATLMPQLDAAHYRLAQIEYLQRRNNLALQSIRRALEVNPFEAEYYFVLSRCLEESDIKAAVEAASRAVTLNGSVADFHNLLGNLLVKLNQLAQAVESYRRAVSIDPGNEAFRANLAATERKLRIK